MYILPFLYIGTCRYLVTAITDLRVTQFALSIKTTMIKLVQWQNKTKFVSNKQGTHTMRLHPYVV